MSPKLQRAKYIFFDFVSAEAAWISFFIYRKKYLESAKFGTDIPLVFDINFYSGAIIIPAVWLILYAVAGFYGDVFRRSRIKETGQSILITLIGTIFLFFAMMLDDQIPDYQSYYKLFGVCFSLYFFPAYFFRMVLTTRTQHFIQKGKIGFNTVIIGSGPKALGLLNEFKSERISTGHQIIGYLSLNGTKENLLNGILQNLGPSENIGKIIDEHQIEEVVIAAETEEQIYLQKVISGLDEKNVIIKADPDMKDLLTGSVRLTAIFGTPLIEISPIVMPVWQQGIKRFIDICASAGGLIFLSPVFAIIAIAIKMNGKGPIFYSQERIGKWGKPFKIHKFRSMKADAESSGPALSSKEDPRITSVGKVLRKYRLDEFPQFFNVLNGDMSLVGPRPERKFFIDKIIEIAPHYKLLHRVKPGITSWGMVKFGYAENVDQMVRRMRYDILYLENMSLLLDFKILIYTILTVVKGRGM